MKKYRLKDGSIWTAETVAKETSCNMSCASQRLRTSDDPVRVLAPSGGNLKTKYEKEFKPKESMSQRMIYDPLGHWNLINKFT